MKLHRGRMIDHVQLRSGDLAATSKFYAATFKVLGIEHEVADDHFSADELWIDALGKGEAKSKTHVHLAFQGKDEAMVNAWHKAGLKAGGTDNGAPGERKEYHPGYYAAFLLDPDGNNVECVYHGPQERSADSVEISFEMPT